MNTQYRITAGVVLALSLSTHVLAQSPMPGAVSAPSSAPSSAACENIAGLDLKGDWIVMSTAFKQARGDLSLNVSKQEGCSFEGSMSFGGGSQCMAKDVPVKGQISSDGELVVDATLGPCTAKFTLKKGVGGHKYSGPYVLTANPGTGVKFLTGQWTANLD